MAEALQVHNRALRMAIEENGGVVFKIVGDSFQAAFSTAPQALQAAIEGQISLQFAPWNELGPLKVRMGLHTGEAQLDPNGDEYAVSHTKNRAARIMSAAHGNQILLSAEIGELVDHQLPEGVSLKDLGKHRLKGMEWLEHLYQVNAPGLPHAFPPLATSITHPNNLPIQVTSFIGREKEIAAVDRLLSSHRLVTLTGSGGTGKSRLSLEVATLFLEQYPNGAWLVELAPLADPELIPKTVASAFNLPEIPGKTVTQALVDYLRPKHLLLILDNCEHLLEACADLGDTLIHACPQLTILATSREFLGVEGETPYRVPPLTLPDPRQVLSLDALSTSDAVRLFVERGRVVAPDFAITERNAGTIVQVVNRLDGIPLAIELAASRLSLLGTDQLLQRLNDTFRLLTGGNRSKLPRHQTLRACIDWSYNLLPEAEHILLRRLSVFAGGWRLHAAEQVCAFESDECQPLCPDDILDLLSELVDKSLVIADQESGGRRRYRMLETVRQFTHEKLVDENEADVFRTRHMAYFLEWAEIQEQKIRSREQIETLNILELELDNLRLAMEWGLQTNAEYTLRIASALAYFWHIRFHWTEGAEWLEKGLEAYSAQGARKQEDKDIAIRAKAMAALGILTFNLEFNDYWKGVSSRPVQLLQESVALYRQAGKEHRRGLAFAMRWLTWADVEFQPGKQEAYYNAQEALTISREINDLFGIAEAQLILAFYKNQWLPEGLSVARSIGDEDLIATMLEVLGHNAFGDGEYEQACGRYQESQEHYRIVGNLTSATRQNRHIALAHFFHGDYAQADHYLDSAIEGFREIGQDAMLLDCLEWRTRLSLAQELFPQAYQCMETIQVICSNSEYPSHSTMDLYYKAVIARRQGDFTLASQLIQEFRQVSQKLEQYRQGVFALFEMGKLSDMAGDSGRAKEHYLEGLRIGKRSRGFFWHCYPLIGLAGLAVRTDEVEKAARLFGLGGRMLNGVLNTMWSTDRMQYRVDMENARAVLGEARYNELLDAGRGMTLDEAIHLFKE